MAIKTFDKYEYEDIRTDYLEFNSNDKIKPDTIIPSRTIVEFDSNSHKLKVAITEISNSNKNSTVFMLAEDCKPSDTGMVYFVIEDVANLE